jgi:glycosyltransferase involved in cell wall biosynthesis
MQPPTIAQVLYVYSEYSTGTGNAMSTKAYHHAREHELAGGNATIVVSDRRRHDYGAGTIVRYSSKRSARREYFTDLERYLDTGFGRLIRVRPFIARFYRDALQAVPGDTDVLIVYNYAGALTRSFCRNFDGLIVLHLGNWVFRSWSRSELRSLFERVDLVVTVSHYLAEMVAAHLGEWPSNLRTVRNGVDLASFSTKDEASTYENRVLAVGNIEPHKGFHNLIAAAHVLAGRRRDFVVQIVGSAGLRPSTSLSAYEQKLRASAEGLEGIVEFMPFVGRRELPSVYRRASIFCMPVEWDEPAGQVVTEAMASGLPVIAPRRGGIPEYLGTAGLYVDPTDPEALAGALDELMSNRRLRSRLGSIARSRACEFTWEASYQQLIEHIYAVRPSLRPSNGEEDR